jgi:hypothetical protein
MLDSLLDNYTAQGVIRSILKSQQQQTMTSLTWGGERGRELLTVQNCIRKLYLTTINHPWQKQNWHMRRNWLNYCAKKLECDRVTHLQGDIYTHLGNIGSPSDSPNRRIIYSELIVLWIIHKHYGAITWVTFILSDSLKIWFVWLEVFFRTMTHNVEALWT